MIVNLGHVGDYIYTTASIREIRRNYPFASVTMIVSPCSYSVAKCCPYVNDIMIFDDSISEKNITEVLSYATDFAKKNLWEKHFSVGFHVKYVCVFHTLATILLYLSGARERVGTISRVLSTVYSRDDALPSNKNYGSILLSHPFIGSSEIVHHCTRSLSMLLDYGLKIYNTDLELWYNASESIKARKLISYFSVDRFKVVVCIGGSASYRKYPVEKYLQVLRAIIEKNANVIILGGSSEADGAKFLQENLPKEHVLNLVEILPGRRVEAAILSEHANMYLGNMTGTADMAGAVHVPCVLVQPTPKYIEEMFIGRSLLSAFYPWQAHTICVYPKVSTEHFEDKKNTRLNFLLEQMQTIKRIEPEQIVNAFDEMIHFLKYSGIRKTTCPPIIRNIDARKKLAGLFDKV